MKTWIVLSSAAVYLGGVWLRARLLKRRLGRSPNLRPRGPQEKWLWAGWTFVALGWAACPFVGGRMVYLETPLSFGTGLAAIVIGLAGTVWCHVTLGDAWRVGVRTGEKTPLVTSGPYGRLRHPIYFFQIVILAGVFLLIPSPFTFSILFVHRLLVSAKVRDEERHLEALHGPLYKEYREKTGGLWPKMIPRRR